MILQVDKLCKQNKNHDSLFDITFEVNPGEIVGIYGLKGSGKTTLLKLIAGLIPPTSGNVTFLAKNIPWDNKEHLTKIGLMLRKQGVYKRLTVGQYLTLFQKLYGADKTRLDESIRITGLIDREHKHIGTFTENEIAKVHMARVYLHNPPLLLLDEPTTYLDMETMEIIRRLIIQQADKGTAIVITTSSREEAEALSHRIGRIDKGRIDTWITPEEEREKEISTRENLVTERIRIEKIPAKVNDRIILFDPPELVFVESNEGSSTLHTINEEFPCPLSMTELEEKLRPFGFFRTHRSYIVNLQRVREVIPWSRNSFSIVVDDQVKSTVPLSKNNRKELENLLGI